MTALISLAITGITLIMLWDTYSVAREPVLPPNPAVEGAPRDEAGAKAAADAYGRQKDILLLALALFGTVTGYYLGRVPAELRAQQGEKAAAAALKVSAETAKGLAASADALKATSARADHGTSTLLKVNDVLTRASESPELSAKALSPHEAIREARRELDAFLRDH